MKPETATLLIIGILAASFTAYAYSKEKPHVASAIMGSFSALSLVYSLLGELGKV